MIRKGVQEEDITDEPRASHGRATEQCGEIWGRPKKYNEFPSEPSKVMHHAQSHNIELNVEIRSICYSFSGHKLLLLIDVLLEVRIGVLHNSSRLPMP